MTEPAQTTDDDLPLWDSETPNIRNDARDMVGQEWLDSPNTWLGGKSPEQTISAGNGGSVRRLLRQIASGDLS